MQHAQFTIGEVLFDTLYCRSVEIIDTPETSDLLEGMMYVDALGSNDTYRIETKHLYTSDEMSAVLGHRDIDDELNQMREQRLQEKASLLKYEDFHPDDISREDIISLQSIEEELNLISTNIEKQVTEMYLNGDISDISPENIASIVKQLISSQDSYATY